ncbi:MAG: guanylate kinase [Tissierellia bacterium]|jgi:guanylate kinase|nr:guanylate kinase [Tissierellia bacterium]
MLERKGLLFILSGPSGAGKGSMVKGIIERRDDIFLSISATCRSPRKGEVERGSYQFLSREEFEDNISRSEYLEWAEIYGNLYGTPKEPVFRALNEGRNIILEIDYQGALQIKRIYPDAIFVFVLPPSLEELRQRVIRRDSETQESLETRYYSALEEIHYLERYDYFIINDKLEESIEKLNAIITAETCRVGQDVLTLLSSDYWKPKE